MSNRPRAQAPELRIGVVGVGQRAPLATLANRPGTARIVSCADPHPRGQDDARRLFGADVAIHDGYEQMLDDDLDAVFVLTPDHLHLQPALFFLEAGVAVFVEKPLAITVADCDALLAAAHRSGSRLYVGHNLRHLPMLRRMRELIDSGAIGSVRAVWCRHFVGHGGDYYFKDWHAEQAKTTGLLLQKGAHDLDAIHWLAGGFTRRVSAHGTLAVYGDNPRRTAAHTDDQRMPDWFDPGIWPPSALRDLNPVIDVEDLSMMLGRLDNGVLTSYQQCHFTPDYWRNYTVIGDEGRMENFGDGVEGDPAVINVWNSHRSGYRHDADLTVPVPETPDGLHGGADQALVSEFLRYVTTGGPTETSPVAAREAVAAATAATTSLRSNGTAVDVPAPDPELIRYFNGPRTPAGQAL
ncbi:Gfo/Idh/MocA family oxidoreductase [Streptomyces sp. NPDC050738]|uniref:Gfo/Idh/MocA family protein n=1 Tax=Streptomyces sp. NPDC050738 TaxID=3154744 RepID=UPI00343F4974